MDDSALYFHLQSPSLDDYVEAGPTLSELTSTEQQPADDYFQTCDFLTTVTAISKAYSCGRYIDMQPLNDVCCSKLADGTHFRIHRATFGTATSSAPGKPQPTRKLIIKRVLSFKQRVQVREAELALFTRELLILHHFRGQENIVQLQGVGWFYDCLDDLTPDPKPALLIEEASQTLEKVIAQSPDLLLMTQTKICSDVAHGLLSIHAAGLVHGDIKPANVLVFEESVIDQGIEAVRLKCKISDFSLTRAVTPGRTYKFKWGTELYKAPEQGFVFSEDLHLIDVWSLGILFARVTERNLDLQPASGNHRMLECMIHEAVHKSIENSTWDPLVCEVRQAMFNHTVRRLPKDRCLEATVVKLEELLNWYWGSEKHRFVLEYSLVNLC